MNRSYFLYTIQKLYLYYYLSKNSLGYIYSRKAMVENLTITMDDSSENKTRHAMGYILMNNNNIISVYLAPIIEKDNTLAKINQHIVADRSEIQFIF